MPGIYFGHGAIFTWDGMRIGDLLTYEFSQSEGSLTDVTNLTTPVIGTGLNSRIEKVFDTLEIDPINLSVSFWGAPVQGTSPSKSIVGHSALLTFSLPLVTPVVYSGIATCRSWTWSCPGVGRLQEGSASFYFGGW